MKIYFPKKQDRTYFVAEQDVSGITGLLQSNPLQLLKNGYLSKYKCQMYCDQMNYDKWKRCMTTPLIDIPQEDLEWAAKQDQYNSYASEQVFLQEIERRLKETE